MRISTYKRYLLMIKEHLKKGTNCIAIISTCIMLLLAGGCAGVPERNPLPMELSDQATLPVLPKSQQRVLTRYI